MSVIPACFNPRKTLWRCAESSVIQVVGALKLFRLGTGVSLLLAAMVLMEQTPAIAAKAGGTLDAVRARGHVVCGTGHNESGFSVQNGSAGWQGLFVDLCRAVASAVLGKGDAIKFRPLAGAERFQAVAKHEVDLLSRSTAWTLSRDAQANVQFVSAFFHDGKGFLIAKSAGVASALELSGARVCLVSGGLTEASVKSYFSRRGMKFSVIVSETWTDAMKRYLSGQCIVLAADVSRLAIERSKLDDPDAHILLPEIFSFDAFGPVVHTDDPRWLKVVRWVIFALLRAEELDLDGTKIGSAARSDDPEVSGFARAAAAASNELGLPEDWLVKVISEVGNYADVYERHFGEDSGVGLKRGRNGLAINGGVFSTPAFR